MAETGTGLVLEKTARRDALIAIEKKYQKIWSEEHQFEIDAPAITDNDTVDMTSEELHAKYPKFMSSMAYPYMNGVLHAGHCFTLSKVEFSIGFERMNGKRALFPLGFHCTGMPILACADKLKREIELFGENFENLPSEEEEKEQELKKEQEKEKQNSAKEVDPTKFKAKKSKAQAKQGRGKYQFEIMMQLGIEKEDVKKFADAAYWLNYFPALCQEDCESIGAKVDWRRSFITTDVNPYYDAFIRWQMNKMKETGKIKFGERYTIYSEKDGQACMDHDRQSGEGITPQEYVGIKIEATELSENAQKIVDSVANFDKSKKIYFVAATLRPETMYGQTCCFVSPKIDYGIFDNGDSYYVTTERAYKNMSYQKITPQRGYYKPVVTISGKDFIGTKINPPLAQQSNLRILPMETVIATKGTGVVTCVPSNSPDDYMTLSDLKNKSAYYGIDNDWVKDLEVLPIIDTEKYGNLTAKTLCEEMKIQSPKDSVKLAEAKKIAYKEDYYSGVMAVGKYKGEKVEVAKSKLKADMIADGTAFVYNEPEGLVISRSGDDCIVSLEDQWYVDYGEESWKVQARECLDQMELFAPEVKNAFEGTLNWLSNWAVSRSYGLGTKLPWDPKYLVESLSDSTIYQSFYTIAHLLFTDYYGKDVGPLGIKADQMTDDVFDYIFQHKDTVNTDIKKESLDVLRREFEYFYPLDVSISGKDLINNHLTFFIYTHVALFPKKFWPRGIRANGHLMLNNQKMSKSTGNFMTLKQIVEKFGADASRIALADAGDTVEDANFDESNANAAILRLYVLKEWAEEVLASDDLRTGEYDEIFDKGFDTEMDDIVEKTYEQYNLTNYKNALKLGLFDFQNSRDYYRDSVTETGKGMHKDLVLKYIETQALLLTPIAPHFCDYVYRELLGNKTSIQNAKFPRASKPVDVSVIDSLNYIRGLQKSIRETEGQALKSKKGRSDVDAEKDVKITVLVGTDFPEWQNKYLQVAKELHAEGKLNDNSVLKTKVEGRDMKKVMPFISMLKQRLASGEQADVVFNNKTTFNELELIEKIYKNDSIKQAVQAINKSKIVGVEILAFAPGSETATSIVTKEEGVPLPQGASKAIENAVPGSPSVIIRNVE
ncbi:cytosolic leucyl tRNA synthetase [Hanseniaspora opuntiae]|jgi:leucyl-tRNA synthetase|uniref:leucine--tRNA ligase n=1 Tax=Hanseniaspora opuntiae TaxID=211096 RepID=A0A1E5RTY5_9ASCO|nr:Leucine--tRNA ligase, cytoplasmic [Hanseniaspora opuntiae]